LIYRNSYYYYYYCCYYYYRGATADDVVVERAQCRVLVDDNASNKDFLLGDSSDGGQVSFHLGDDVPSPSTAIPRHIFLGTVPGPPDVLRLVTVLTWVE